MSRMNTLSNSKIGFNGEATLGAILQKGGLRVPPNQREFSWKATHVRELLRDIKPIIDDRSGQEYFFGTIVVLRDRQDQVVVDGQQRLATTAIFLAAIRDYYARENDQEGVDSIQPEYLLKRRMPERRLIPQLRLSDSDHKYFERRILSLPDSDERKSARSERLRPSERLISAAAATAAEQVAAILKDEKSENRTAALTRWVNFFVNQARVILVTVEDEAVAYTVFETMNDRGLELSATDLIKNRLYSLSRDKLEQTKRSWTKMLGILESVQSSTIVKDYVRHYWISKHGRTRAPVLFKDIREEVSNQKRATDFAAELERNALQYVALMNPENEIWKPYRPIMKEYVSALTTLDVKQVRPLLLSILRIFGKSELLKAFRLMVSLTVRLMAADQLGRGALETEYESAALEVDERKIITTDALIFALKKIIPPDDKFVEDFSVFEVTNAAHARYILRVLDAANSRTSPAGVSARDEPTLEHILPLNPKNLRAWNVTSEEHLEYVHRLGNLALLPNESNSLAGSADFPSKRTIFLKQTSELTKEIAEFADWGKGQIEERQKRLAAIALKAWPVRV